MNIYGVEKKSSYRGIKAVLKAPTFEELEEYRSGLQCVARTYCEGYINNDMTVICGYGGYYGEGIIECTQHINVHTGRPSSNYMNIAYYVKENEND